MTYTFALHLKPISFDYSNVSGFFGPGAFWAWVISLLTGFCPNEGLHLMRVIWKEPWEYPLSFDNASELPPLPAEKKPGESTTDVSNNDSGQDDVLEKDKMDCIRQFLKKVMQNALTDDMQRSPELVGQFLELNLWLSQLRLNNQSFFFGYNFDKHSDNFLLQAECADHVMDSLPLFITERTTYLGLMRYSTSKSPRVQYRMERTYELPRNLRATCSWFELNETDFIHYLKEFRNRVQFWMYQYKASEAEIPRKMDANTWAAALYALVSCWVCLIEHGRCKSKTWRPEDDAASCVAQVAYGASTLALLSSHPRKPESSRKSRTSLRSSIWMVVYLHAWFVMLCRGYFVEDGLGIASILGTAQFSGLLGLLCYRMPFLVVLEVEPTRSWIARRFTWLRLGPAQSVSELRQGTVFLCTLLQALALLSSGRRFLQIPKIPWTLHAGPPIPKSSASILDLDQAAALATAVFLLLAIPLQFAIISFGRVLWRGYRVVVSAIPLAVLQKPWSLYIMMVFVLPVLPVYAILHPVRAVKMVVGSMQSVLRLIRTSLAHLRGSSRQEIDGQAMELQRRTTSQMEQDDKQLRLPRCSPQLRIHVKSITKMGKGPLERKLKFEKKNTDLVKLPKYAKVEKRPIPHAPVASPYAGASVPKVVYVSSSTPFMSAVKRVQKLLIQAEKRATANISLENTRKSEQQILEELSKVSEKREEVFVKATGRAIEKALNVGKWFEEKATQYVVRIKTGSVLVVDDVVEDEEKKQKEQQKQQQSEKQSQSGPSTDPSKTESQSTATKRKHQDDPAESEDELPESRTRWIKMVEVAVTLK
ncbi:unnamed protein product [Penicillium salamii]|uniref:Uncharacterized protein n=1 Tax=Penicillium salamii TaxID=1612424 RepID=A0A9W4JZ38_9EURO|nr:unnamed protein product [Penicillium salamii]CAG8378304.1 unnamed protein product [Penicillium salamii]CAG8419441.1 unnamed protein product [Penicillium salamii]CAG8422849.1 unnamed protein product [Penicillium salamii]